MAKLKTPLNVAASQWEDRDKRYINHRVTCSACQVTDVAVPSGALAAAEGRSIYAMCPDCQRALHPDGVPVVGLNAFNRVSDSDRVKLPAVAYYARLDRV